MKCFEVNSISGLYNEFYVPVDFDKITGNDNEYFFSNLNNYFWKKIFSDEFIDSVLKLLDEQEDKTKLSIWEKAVLYNERRFKTNLKNGLKLILDYNCSKKEMFSILEIFSIYCSIISKYYFNPIKFTLQEGIISADNSIKKIVEQVQNQNKCKKFVSNLIAPKVEKVDFLWINGTINYCNLIVIEMFKKMNDSLFVAVRFHESEYFSYNKITDYLKENQLLFKYIDCIVLDNCEETFGLVEKSFKNKNELNKISNIIYVSDGEIFKTKTERKIYYLKNYIKMPYIEKKKDRINKSPVVNMRLFANNSCHWHQCAFCGINKKYKYQYDNILDDLLDAINIIKSYYSIGYQYFWFEDEAIKKQDVIDFGNLILINNLKIFWQIRSRFEEEYSLEECRVLYQAGLREIRFGYESGSRRVLKKMNKYPEDFNYDIIENNVRNFSSANINVHLPVILGFPVETKEDKKETISKLIKLKQQFDITFNLNRFLLDVASEAFRNFNKYNIYELQLPTECNDFIGNFAYYNFSIGAKELDEERALIMREVLYPWMPTTALTIPIIFYRLTESSRMTLIWASRSLRIRKNNNAVEYIINENISVIEENVNNIIIYIWDNHFIIRCKKAVFEILQSGKLDLLEKKLINQLIEKRLLI